MDSAQSSQLNAIAADGTVVPMSFAEPVEIEVSTNPLWLVLKDVDQDQTPELMVLHPVSGEGDQLEDIGKISILRATGSATTPYVLNQTIVLDGARRQHFVVEDFDHDQIQDFGVINFIGDSLNGSFSYLKGQSQNGLFTWIPVESSLSQKTVLRTSELGKFPVFLVSADWNQDGFMDIGVLDRSDDSLSILMNETQSSVGPYFPVNSPIVDRAPLKSKDCLEVLPAGIAPANASYFVLNGGCMGHDLVQMAVGDWNNDCYPDLAVLDLDKKQVQILINIPRTGVDSFNACQSSKMGLQAAAPARTFERHKDAIGSLSTPLPLHNGPRSLVAGDWDHDGNQDLAVTSQQKQLVFLYYGDGTGGFTSQIQRVELYPRQLASGDLNQDGVEDFVTTNLAESDTGGAGTLVSAGPSGDLGVMLSTGKRSYAIGRIASSSKSAGAQAAAVLIRDINQDHKPDLIVSLPFEKKIAVIFQK